MTRYGYDALGRKIAETNANSEVTQYSYNSAGDMITLTDAKSHGTQWGYDQYGRNTNMVDATGTTILRFKYDQDGRLTNRWSAAKGDTYYTLDKNGNVTFINYPSSPDLTFSYDALNRVTNMVDAVGATTFAFTSFGALSSEVGPWANDAVTYSYYNNHLRGGLSLAQPNASPWAVSYSYDGANRLQTLGAPQGNFTYFYQGDSFTDGGGCSSCGGSFAPSGGSLIKALLLPSGSYITNTFDSVGRTTATVLENSANSVLNSHTYTYNSGNQRTRQTRTLGDYVDYSYDFIGQLMTTAAKESGGVTNRLHENFYYGFDAAHNLTARTNSSAYITLAVDSLNQFSSSTHHTNIIFAGFTTSAATNVSLAVSASSTLFADNTFVYTNVVIFGSATLGYSYMDALPRQVTEDRLPPTTAFLIAHLSLSTMTLMGTS